MPLTLNPSNTSSLISHRNHPLTSRQHFPAIWWYPSYESAALVVIGLSLLALAIELLAYILALVINNVLTSYAKNRPPDNQITLTYGKFRWEFGCLMHPVPQDFLQEYFRLKNEGLKRGFAPIESSEWYTYRGHGSRQCYARMRVTVGEYQGIRAPRGGNG